MNSDPVLKLLNDYHPHSLKEKKDKRKIIDFIENNKNFYERELLIGHVTSSSWLVTNDLSQVLLMRHKKLDKWLQFGGHVEAGFNIIENTFKETIEESGIQEIELVSNEIFDLDIHTIPAKNNVPEHFHYDIRFLMKIKNDEQPVKNDESTDLKFFSKNILEFPSSEESMLRMFHKWAQ